MQYRSSTVLTINATCHVGLFCHNQYGNTHNDMFGFKTTCTCLNTILGDKNLYMHIQVMLSKDQYYNAYTNMHVKHSDS